MNRPHSDTAGTAQPKAGAHGTVIPNLLAIRLYFPSNTTVLRGLTRYWSAGSSRSSLPDSSKSAPSVFDTVWTKKKGTPLAGIGEGAYFDEKGLNTGVVRAKRIGLTLQLVSGFMTKSLPAATMQSWTEQILKRVAGRL